MPDAALDLAALDALAQQATPGPWEFVEHGQHYGESARVVDPGDDAVVDDGSANDEYGATANDNDLRYIAAVSPDVVRALIAALREARRIMSQCADALESDSELDVRRAAFEEIQSWFDPLELGGSGIVDEPKEVEK